MECTDSKSMVTISDTMKTYWPGWEPTGAWRLYNRPITGETVFAVCKVGLGAKSDENLLLTPIMDVGPAHSVHIEVHFTMRRCGNHPDPTSLKSCEETVSLLLREQTSTTVDKEEHFKMNEDASYFDKRQLQKFATIAPDKKWDVNSQQPLNQWKTEIKVAPGSRIRLGLRDTGSCVTVTRVHLYYLACPEVLRGFAHFPSTPAQYGQEVFEVAGRCVVGADPTDPVQSPRLLCLANGRWHSQVTAACQCSRGFTPFPDGTEEGRVKQQDNTNGALEGNECSACPEGFYKADAGKSKCRICPENSQSERRASFCSCKNGFFRHPTKETMDDACTSPPTSPVNISFIPDSKDGTRVHLKWSPPHHLGGRRDLYYSVECQQCARGLTFTPATTDHLSDSSVTMNDVKPGQLQIVRVFARNGVSSFVPQKEEKYSEIAFRLVTQVALAFDDIRLSKGHGNSVLVTWNVSAFTPEEIQSYELVLQSIEDSSKTGIDRSIQQSQKAESNKQTVFAHSSETLITKESVWNITNIQIAQNYELKIRCLTLYGWTAFSQPIYFNVNANVVIYNIKKAEEGEPSTAPRGYQFQDNWIILIATAMMASLLLVFLSICIVLLVRRRLCWYRRWKKEVLIGKPLRNGKSASLCSVHMSAIERPSRTYVDPSTYEDPHAAVNDFTKPIDPSSVIIDTLIGEGEFGEVYKGTLTTENGKNMTVAVKILKEGATEKHRTDFLLEATIMGQFKHDNVLALLGVVTQDSMMIVSEFLENGALDALLRSRKQSFTTLQLLHMQRGIALGMTYLSNMRYVHRDLAARNILVDEELNCKVSDFGLSREIEADTTIGAYTTKGGKIPVRWTAPEAIHYRKFTSASDVWSFGVVMWEIMSLGERPYWTFTNQEVILAVDSGYRLPPPVGCPAPLHQLMLACWTQERRQRPKFPMVWKALDNLYCIEQQQYDPQMPRSQTTASISSLSGKDQTYAVTYDSLRSLHQNPPTTALNSISSSVHIPPVPHNKLISSGGGPLKRRQHHQNRLPATRSLGHLHSVASAAGTSMINTGSNELLPYTADNLTANNPNYHEATTASTNNGVSHSYVAPSYQPLLAYSGVGVGGSKALERLPLPPPRSFTVMDSLKDTLLRQEAAQSLLNSTNGNVTATGCHPSDSVGEWLRSLQLPQYVPHFLSHGMNTLEVVSCLTHVNLYNMGIHHAPHQRILLNNIHALRCHFHPLHLKDGFLV